MGTTSTTNYNLLKPNPFEEDDTWGSILNSNLDKIDTQMKVNANAITALDAAKQPLDADLTAIAALAGTSGFLKKTAADTWSLDTATYSVVGHTHVMANITDLQAAMDAKAPLASPAFTGTPTAPTPATADSSTKIATTAYVKASMAAAGAGTVTSVAVSGGTTGLTTSGGPITGAGTITLGGTLAIANGGTGANTATLAKLALGIGTAGDYNIGTSGGTVPLLNATNTFASGQNFGTGSGAANANVNGGSGSARTVTFQTNGGSRWQINVTSATESGSQAGSNFSIRSYLDDGTTVADTPITITRSTGNVSLLGVTSLEGIAPGMTRSTSGTSLAATSAVKNIIIDRTSTLASMTVTLPTTGVLSGQEMTILTRSSISSITVNGEGGASVYNPPGSMTAGVIVNFVYANGAWFCGY